MRWFSHRRSRTREYCSRQNRTQAAVNVHCRHPVSHGGHTMESSAAACSVQPTAHASPYHALSMGMTRQLFVFCPRRSWRPLTFDLRIRTRQEFCTVHLTAKFHHPTFNRLEVIVRTNKLTNKQTPLKTSISLRYATPVFTCCELERAQRARSHLREKPDRNFCIRRNFLNLFILWSQLHHPARERY